MEFRGKLHPVFVNDPDPNNGFSLSLLMDFEQANKERRLGKISLFFSSNEEERK